MQILKIVDGDYPWDVRVEKVARTLTEGGHQVHMVARNRKRSPLLEELPEATMHRLRPWSFLGRSLDSASQFPAFMNPRWARLALRTGRSTGAELVLVRDLPLAPLAIWTARRLGVPAVLDMAENYPAMIRDLWTTGSTRPGDALVRNPRAVEAVERWTMARIDHTIVVVEESGERLVTELGVPPERITVVGNTPSLDRLEAFPPRAAPLSSETRPLRLVYLGLMEEARGVRTVIEAAGALKAKGRPVELTLIGDGRARIAFEERATELGLEPPMVRFLGFVPYSEALVEVAKADVGLIPHLANESWNTTIPNKLFDYMAAGLCVATSDARPAARVVQEAGAGVVFRSGDAEDLARKLDDIGGPGACHDRGARGREAVRETHHWEVDAARLLSVVEELRQVG
jgi:glycosyltransferase involved in cell wall biosynthesis